MSSSESRNMMNEEEDPFAPPPPPPSQQKQQAHTTNQDNIEYDQVLVEYSFRDFEKFTSVTQKDVIAYQSGRKSFFDILYDKKTPCGEIYEDMMNYVHKLAVESKKDISVDDIKDSVQRKTFLECIDFHSHLYETRAKNIVRHVDSNSQ
ncbi:hypothetical protein C9374_009428 [Naegleria lovaniensis]|uniref:Uncharacterized protein n=1 Tax=Naegleria lovaniensis TaxID=51637 RepID=A0AA88H2S4_NAELO|nr:uncharacterized protein C9374_009428 [Naegleria lovaniensis]KAG2392851.1 hypothetical protein C9374_009428 [Naegleria lovaniensis]